MQWEDAEKLANALKVIVFDKDTARNKQNDARYGEENRWWSGDGDEPATSLSVADVLPLNWPPQAKRKMVGVTDSNQKRRTKNEPRPSLCLVGSAVATLPNTHP